MGSLGTMGVLVDVRVVLVSGGLHKWSGLGVVEASVSGARTVLDGWVVLGWAVGVLEGWGEAGFVGLWGSGPLTRCVGRQPW